MQMTTEKEKGKEQSAIVKAMIPALALLALMWLISILSLAGIVNPATWGVVPRTISGLWGVLTAPLVHANLGHLFANSFSFFILLSLIFFFYRKSAWEVLFGGWILTGLWVWIGARSSSHIGASGLIYCFAFFIFFSGIFRKEIGSLALGLIVVFLYGGMVWGLLPVQPGVSWESHLFGGAAGALLAWLLKERGKNPKKKYSWENEPDESPDDDKAVWNFKKEFITNKDDE